MQVRLQLYPFCEMSATRLAYFWCFRSWALDMFCSNGNVSSSRWTCFVWVLIMTMSVRSLETMMLAGRVPPVVVKPDILEKIWVFFEFGPMAFLRYFRRWSRIELWHQVNLPWLRDIEQWLRIWWRVSRLLHNLQLVCNLLPHVLKFVKVGRKSIEAWTAKLKQPLEDHKLWISKLKGSYTFGIYSKQILT